MRFFSAPALRNLARDPRTQAAALLITGLCAGFPSSASHPVLAGRGIGPVPAGLTGFERLSALPELPHFQRAGELPSDGAMRRDLFVFEGPRPAPTIGAERFPRIDAPPIAPDPHAQALESAPKALRYLGFVRGNPAGLLGAFMRGEEAETLQPGTVLSGWRLLAVEETTAVFQSLQFPDLRFTLHAKGDS